MITKPMHVLKQYPVRKSKQQKSEFRDAAVGYFENIGYKTAIESGSWGAKNIVVGNPETAKYLVTAHYDTPARMLIPNLITPCHLLPFILWQIFMTLLLLAPGILVGTIIGYLTNDFLIGFNSVYIFFLVESILMIAGPANPNNANDNTSGVVAVMDVAYNLPKEYRDRVCFVLFDLEEAGLIGSASYAKKRAKVVKHQVVLNMDCVGNGLDIVFFPSSKFRKNSIRMKWLCQWDSMWTDGRRISIRKSGFMFYPSDQMNFPLGIGISALEKNRFGWLYCDRVHTKKDVILDDKNISVLQQCIISMIQHDKVFSIT